ncbi:MAG: tRNA (adenosine(37)-N6)-threonylcarbamoyltransferase complex transferase subunit TsaD [Sulfobacillus sp.]
MPQYVLGIDTSAYTTSVAVVDGIRVCFDERRVLPVALGQRGLRSSDAVYSHVRNLPALYQAWCNTRGIEARSLAAVAVSTRPRPQPDSYLPSFAAGEGFGQVIAESLDIPLFKTSHQEGHIRAGLFSAAQDFDAPFHVLHVSGGTTELLRVIPEQAGHWDILLVGGSDDLYAGQFIDRVGVRLGLPFPAGAELEKLAMASEHPVRFNQGPPRSRDGKMWISFSGMASAAERAIDNGDVPADIARGVEWAAAHALFRLLKAALPPGPVLVVGGVAANQTIRQYLSQHLVPEKGWTVSFGSPSLSRDNAVGVAWIGWDQWSAP